MAGALEVWMNGVHVGVWHASRSGVSTFQYDAAWAASRIGRPLSLSLPITAGTALHRGDAVAHYFDNLLPDSDAIRRRLSARFKTRSTQAFDLLAAIGRDCVGAVQLLPEGAGPEGWNRIAAEPLTDAEVEQILVAASTEPPFGQRTTGAEDDDFRISIAGAQEKTALLRFGGVWHRPHGATPTTHILKLPLGRVGNRQADMTTSVANEWLSVQILRELGLRVANVDMAVFGAQQALVVERFDRRWQGIQPGAERDAGFTPPVGSWIARLPQEDLCQATGTAPNRKYESDGGPTMADVLKILGSSDHPDADRSHFALSQLAFWLLAATDGHAKNFSLFLLPGGRFQLTPLYDVLSAWPVIGNRASQVSPFDAALAMAVRSKNVHRKLREIEARHWQGLAQRCGAPGVWAQMLDLVDRVEAALARTEALLPGNFPPPVWQAVHKGVRAQAARFRRECKALAAT